MFGIDFTPTQAGQGRREHTTVAAVPGSGGQLPRSTSWLQARSRHPAPTWPSSRRLAPPIHESDADWGLVAVSGDLARSLIRPRCPRPLRGDFCIAFMLPGSFACPARHAHAEARPVQPSRAMRPQSSIVNWSPALACRRRTRAMPIAAPGVQTPPPVIAPSTSCTRQSALSLIIFEVEP
jgi:hypothetical protein